MLPHSASTLADTGHSKFVEPDSPTYTSSPHQGTPPLNTQTSSWSAGSGNSSMGSVGRKSTFMDKVKGEVKVLSGKLSHNEERIEEGKKLMGKA